MGKTKKLYLTRRILAMILAAAMTVTMVPSTALAAPADGDAGEAIVNAVAEESGDVTAPENDGDPEDTDAIVSDGEAAVDENEGEDDAAAPEVKTGDDAAPPEDKAEDDGAISGENAEVNDDTPAATSDYKIVINYSFATKAEYNGEPQFTDVTRYVTLEKDGESVDDETPACTWKQKGADGNYAALTAGTAPKNAGSYQAVFSYAKKDGVHDPIESEPVEFEITKAPVTITMVGQYGSPTNRLPVTPGTKTSDIAMPEIDSVRGGYNEIDKEDLTLTMEIKNALTGATLGADDVLVKGGDYVMAFTPAYKDTVGAKKDNYELKPFTVDIEIADLIDTHITVTLADKWKQEDGSFVITKEYDEEPISDPEAGADKDYTVKVTYQDTDGTDKEIDDAKVTGEWIDQYNNPVVDEDGKATNPVNAGSYYYKVVYPGKDGIYAGAVDYINVEITKMELTVEATNDPASLSFPEQTTVEEVLAKITYKVLNKAGVDVTADVKAKHIWGAGYSASGRSQIYEPLFTVQMSSDGTTWTNIYDSSQKLQKDETTKYRVAFTGRKATLNANGSIGNVYSDINSTYPNGGNPNYNTTAAKDKELALEVKAATKAVINVDGLLGDQKGAKKIEDLKPKQYDGAPIFTAASQYKNAVKLTKEDGTEITTEQREFTYEWTQGYGDGARYDDRIDALIAEKNGTFAWSWYRRSGTALTNAGVYKLTISYEDKIDPDTYNQADPVTIYFAIDPREVTITPKEESYEILEGKSIWDFFYGEKEIEYEVKAKDGGALPNEDVVPRGEIKKETTATPPVADRYYDQDDEYDYLSGVYFERKDNIEYYLMGCDIRYYDSSEYEYYSDSNYTCLPLEYEEKDGVWSRKSGLVPASKIEVLPMGTGSLTITVDSTKWVAKEKEYDAKPFELKDLIQDGLVTVTKAGDAEAELTYRVVDENGYYEPRALESVVAAGTYDLYVYFEGDTTYKPYGRDDEHEYGMKLGTFKITQKEIELTADLDETYKAGTSVSSVLEDVNSRYKVTGYVTGQGKAFEKSSWGDAPEAWDYGPYFYMVEKGSNTRLYSYDTLERNKSYEVRYDRENSELSYYSDYRDTVNNVWIYPARDYKIKNEPVAEFTTVPGNSSIASVDWPDYSGAISSVEIQTKNDASDPMKREVTMTEAIKWSSYTLTGYNNKKLEGNLIALEITAPAEYGYSMPATAMYQNEIEAKGGYVVEQYRNTFTAVFDAADGKDREIKLRWEDGYVETYTLKFSEAVKLENLNNAVAAKALAFNAAPKKLAVGDEAQLDVKITKEQMGDVIYLGYESSDSETLVVTKSGYVTALKLGTATVTVFPQHLVNGKPERIPNAKSATLKIQVTKLDAPKKMKATPHGTYVELNYDSPAYGYRREIYIVEKTGNSPKNAADFERILNGMRENQWQENGFAIAPIYITKSTEDSNRNSYGYARSLRGLDIKKDYTIYVRNVCAVRTLTDGTGGVVTQEAMNASAAGAVVNVKTKKAELAGLDLTFYNPETKTYYYDYENYYKGIKFSELKNGTLECSVEGAFPEVLDSGKLLNNEWSDFIWLKLPFGKEDKNKYKNVYEEPKLEYALSGCYDKKTDTYVWGTKNDFASIDKKGKIKITGFPGSSFEVRVRDTVTGEYAVTSLYVITEEADSVKAAKSSVTLSVGQEVNLRTLLTYYLGKVKLTAYPNRSIDLEKVRKAIKDQNQDKKFTVDEYGNLTAIEGGGTLTLSLTDTNVEAKSGADKATAKVVIKSKDLEQVKNLKAYDVIHDNFGLTFKYSGAADSFLLEISDAKKPIYSKVISRYNSSTIQPVYATDKDGKYIEVYDEYYDYSYWARVKDTYMISNSFIRSEGIKLYKESQYTVKLTPIYGEVQAKPTTAKVRTTKIPAYASYLNNRYTGSDWEWGCDRKGGMSITVSEGNRNLNLSSSRTTLYAVSGDTYTLTATVSNRGRVNDTLIWTVGDAKVASVKAAAGTYCITLKGLKPGQTTLEVKSKILGNKVIARYNINVSAVQNAYSYNGNGNDQHRYYGENERD